MAHESHALDTLFLVLEPDLVFMEADANMRNVVLKEQDDDTKFTKYKDVADRLLGANREARRGSQ